MNRKPVNDETRTRYVNQRGEVWVQTTLNLREADMLAARALAKRYNLSVSALVRTLLRTAARADGGAV